MNRSLLTALLAAVIPCAALAQNYPTKPIRIIVPFPPGAFNDTLGRIIAQKFSEGGMGQAFVDNRAGAGSTSAELTAFLRNEVAKWAKVIKEANVKID